MVIEISAAADLLTIAGIKIIRFSITDYRQIVAMTRLLDSLDLKRPKMF